MTAKYDFTALQELMAEPKAILGAIDQLRALGLGKIVEPPQLIVVGNQSAGKSSVLKAVSHLPFPVMDGDPTPFPTKVILRSGPTRAFDAKVRGTDASEFSSLSFEDMDLSQAIISLSQQTNLSRWTGNVFEAIISGPEAPRALALVDLPGFRHHPQNAMNFTSEVSAAKHVAESYMGMKMSLKMFANNVATLAIENCLVSGLPEIFIPDKVHEMTDGMVRQIATEPRQVARERDEQQAKLQKLKKVLALLREHVPRRFVDLSSAISSWRSIKSEPTQITTVSAAVSNRAQTIRSKDFLGANDPKYGVLRLDQSNPLRWHSVILGWFWRAEDKYFRQLFYRPHGLKR
ncbi:hypothetical protein OQA88_11142 [Cercophora sp. LCS_1]